MREANDVVFDRALYLWFSQRNSKGDPILGPLLCEKALELNEKLGGSADFKASALICHAPQGKRSPQFGKRCNNGELYKSRGETNSLIERNRLQYDVKKLRKLTYRPQNFIVA
ncbi:hypothetical protein TNCV_2145861 [Trichonephila clavipes]|uniref:HTH CENPB-type domain-containing protein n=1 Tax=Trichonephila clavipes TaxID=2585209 RepID=A0A8X6T6L4_TRICX|nr:hypothetical protein TNCV_2145861 [Trichonephila clavipes]